MHTRYVGLEAFGTNMQLVVEIKQAQSEQHTFSFIDLDVNAYLLGQMHKYFVMLC